MMIGKFLCATALVAVAVPAAAAVTVVGGSAAQSCYEAAASTVVLSHDLGVCDRALSEEALTRSERVATLVNRGILKMRDGRTAAAIVDFDDAIADIGSASCRETVCQPVYISVDAVSFKKK